MCVCWSLVETKVSYYNISRNHVDCFVLAGRAAYHYVAGHRDRVSLFEKRVGGGVVDVSQFGAVIKSGWGEYPTEEVIKAVDEELIRKANLDTNPRSDATPLHISVFREKKFHVQFLLDAGADANARDCFGMTPLHLAAMRGDLSLVKMLDRNGADFTVRDDKGRTPLDVARLNEHESVGKYIVDIDLVEQVQVGCVSSYISV
jgi:hypothetical protein